MQLIAIMIICGIVLVAVIVPCAVLLGQTVSTPKQPKGWVSMDYDAARSARAPLTDLMSTLNVDPTKTPMINFKTATANFGGIFTENMDPWAGSVQPEAARLQVYAGARAIVFDVWPDPAQPNQPVICAMTDVTQSAIQRWWYNNGLEKGVGRYSNWQVRTRNKQPAQTIIGEAVSAAFDSSNRQASDPFFIILKLHGAMNTRFLNQLGEHVGKALNGRGMAVQSANQYNMNEYCNVPVSEFLNKAFVIVIPDIQKGYYSLPTIRTYDKFAAAFKGTTLAQYTNVLETQINTVSFDPNTSINALKAEIIPACGGGTNLVAPTTAGFTLLQPTTGGPSTANNEIMPNATWTDLMESGAHFVAVNLFSPNKSDPHLESFFDAQWFGKYSFHPN